MAMVVWAAALEAQRARRGAAVLVLLTLAGLLRPEAWVLAALYWCWVAWKASWRDRFVLALLAAVAPVLWALTDWAVTGDPLFSLHYTSSSAEDLGRQLPLVAAADRDPRVLRPPGEAARARGGGGRVRARGAAVAAPRGGAAGAARRGDGTFVLIGIAGASAIERYLAVAAVALLVFAGVALGGFTMLEPRAARALLGGAAARRCCSGSCSRRCTSTSRASTPS